MAKTIYVLDTSDYDAGSLPGAFMDKAIADAAEALYNRRPGHGSFDAHAEEVTLFESLDAFAQAYNLVRSLYDPIRVAFLKPGGMEHAVWPKVIDLSFWTFCGSRVIAESAIDKVRDYAPFLAASPFACKKCKRLVVKHGYRENPTDRTWS